MTDQTTTVETEEPPGLRLTVTFEFDGRDSVERAQEFVTRWMAKQLRTDPAELRPVKVQAMNFRVGQMHSFRVPSAAKELTRRRKDLGLTQAQLGELASVHQVTVSAFERGVIPKSSPSYAAIVAALEKAEAQA
ncbi:helix-turn-helix domain-containing protein [Microbispora sp. NPDC004025]